MLLHDLENMKVPEDFDLTGFAKLITKENFMPHDVVSRAISLMGILKC